jgi:hypothetical protein
MAGIRLYPGDAEFRNIVRELREPFHSPTFLPYCVF